MSRITQISTQTGKDSDEPLPRIDRRLGRGVLAAAFLQVAVAAADTAADISANAFTIDGTTFDPGADGYNTFAPLVGIAPLLQIGGQLAFGGNPLPGQSLEVYENGTDLGTANTAVNSLNLLGINTSQFTVEQVAPPVSEVESALNSSGIDFSGVNVDDLATALVSGTGLNALPFGTGDITGNDVFFTLLATQDLDVYGSGGSELRSINTGVNTMSLLGLINSTQLTVTSVDPASGVDASALPDVGTVYNVTDFGGGFENVYEAVPNSAGTAASSITDYLVTPWGNIDLSTVFDAIAQMDPGDAAAGVTVAGTSAADAAAESFNLFDPSTWF